MNAELDTAYDETIAAAHSNPTQTPWGFPQIVDT